MAIPRLDSGIEGVFELEIPQFTIFTDPLLSLGSVLIMLFVSTVTGSVSGIQSSKIRH
jgi:hypothetical protein